MPNIYIKDKRFPLIFAAILVASGTVVFLLARSLGLEISYAQILTLPFILIMLSRIRIFGEKIPRGIILSALALGIVGVGVSYNAEMFNRGGIYVARFEDDPLESKSRVFRKKFTSTLVPVTKVKALRYPLAIKDDHVAHKILVDEGKDALIWGTTKWINVTLRTQNNLKLGQLFNNNELIDIPIPGVKDFTFIQSPNSFGLSLRKKAHTDVFLAYTLTAALSSDRIEREAFYKLAGFTNSFWSSNAHKAYPLWRLGNIHFVNAFKDGEYQSAELDCALSSYEQAASFLDNARINIDLHSAILTNHAIALYIKSKLEFKPELKDIYVYEFYKARHRRLDAVKDISEVSIREPLIENMHLLIKLGEYESEKAERRSRKGLGLRGEQNNEG